MFVLQSDNTYYIERIKFSNSKKMVFLFFLGIVLQCYGSHAIGLRHKNAITSNLNEKVTCKGFDASLFDLTLCTSRRAT